MQSGRQEYGSYILSQLTDFLGTISTMITTYGIFLLGAYIVMVLLILLVYRYMQKTNKHILQLLNKAVDRIIYEQSLIMYRNRQNIYNLTDSLPILSHHMETILTDITQRDYRISYTMLKKDIDYIESFFGINMAIERKSIDELYHLALSIRDRYHKIQKSLIYMTLGIANIII